MVCSGCQGGRGWRGVRGEEGGRKKQKRGRKTSKGRGRKETTSPRIHSSFPDYVFLAVAIATGSPHIDISVTSKVPKPAPSTNSLTKIGRQSR